MYCTVKSKSTAYNTECKHNLNLPHGAFLDCQDIGNTLIDGQEESWVGLSVTFVCNHDIKYRVTCVSGWRLRMVNMTVHGIIEKTERKRMRWVELACKENCTASQPYYSTSSDRKPRIRTKGKFLPQTTLCKVKQCAFTSWANGGIMLLDSVGRRGLVVIPCSGH